MAKSAEEMSEEIAVLIEDMREKAVRETRKDVADAIEEQFLGKPRVSRSMYNGASPDTCILEFLNDDYPPLAKERRLQGLLDRFNEDGITDDFRAGILFAVRLAADPEFEL